MIGSKVNEAYDKAKKCLDQLLSNDQIPFYVYVEIMLHLDVMKRERSDERPQGEWIIDKDVYCICPFCNNKEVKYSNYCPNCGANMRGIENE